MDIVIVGAGQVGRHVAEGLSATHDVAVVDLDPERVDTARYELDVMGVEGDATVLDTLREAEVEECDQVIASTDDDKTNIVVCGMVKIISDAFTIARINTTSFLESWRQGKRALGVDFMVGANHLSARAISQIVGLPAARDVDAFVEGRVHMAEFVLPPESPIEHKSIREINESGEFSELNVMAVFTENGDTMEFKFPRGDTIVGPEDRILVAGGMSAIHRFSRLITPGEDVQSEIVIFGGGEVGFQVAKMMEGSGYNLRLIERDEERARFLAEELPETIVLNEDAEKPAFLLDEHVDEADVVVSALGEDDRNLLVSLLSKQLGAERAVSVVNNQNYVDLFEQVGVDAAVNPRLLTAEEITRYTRGSAAENVAILESEHAEVLEFEVREDSPIANRSIEDAVGDLPREVVFGAITRDHDFVLPRGNVVIRPGDHVLILVGADHVRDLQDRL